MSESRSEFFFPAEWEKHAGTWLAWPHNEETWPTNLIDAQSEFVEFARTLSSVEPTRILIPVGSQKKIADQFGLTLQRPSDKTSTNHNSGERGFRQSFDFSHSPHGIELIEMATNDAWVRDYGPTFVKNKHSNVVSGIDWIYNGWGEKYPPFDQDANVARQIIERVAIERIGTSIVMEGGAIDSNGEGIAMTTSSCLFNENRNRKIAKNELINELKTLLGAAELLIVDPTPIDGDDTDGHIDQVCRFLENDRMVCSKSQTQNVERAISEFEKKYDLIELPDPDPIRHCGRQLPASYTNFYFANEIAIVPGFGIPQDETAFQILREQLAPREVIQLPSRNLLVGLGSFHCLSQQQPE